MVTSICKECGQPLGTSTDLCLHCGAKKSARGSGSRCLIAVIALMIFGYVPLHSRSAVSSESTKAEAGHSDWTVIGSRGKTKLVVVSKAKEDVESVYREAIAALCASETNCFISFWSDRAQAASSLPMSDAQGRAMTAIYSKNTTKGLDQLLWNCRVKKGPQHCLNL